MHQGDLHLLAGTQRVINRRTRNNLAIPSNKQSGQIITLSHNLLSIMYCFYQIEVFYLPFSDHLGSGDSGIGRLYPNVKVTKLTLWWSFSQFSCQGCGYPPSLQCVPFFEEFGSPGENFSCFVSSLDPGVVIHSLDIGQVITLHWHIITVLYWQIYTSLVYSILIPLCLFSLSSVYLALAYYTIYNKQTQVNTWDK